MPNFPTRVTRTFAGEYTRAKGVTGTRTKRGQIYFPGRDSLPAVVGKGVSTLKDTSGSSVTSKADALRKTDQKRVLTPYIMSEYIFETVEALDSKQRDVVENGNLKEGAAFFRRYYSGYILSLSLAVFFALAGFLALEQMFAMPDQFGTRQPGTQYFLMAIFLGLGSVGLLTSFIFMKNGWRDLQIYRKQKSGSFDFGLRLDATGLLARPAVKGKPFSCAYVPLEEIDRVKWEAKGRTVSGDRYRTIDHYARLDLKSQQKVYLYLNNFAGDGVDLAADIGRWVEKSRRK